ncbi:hypothetical protein PENTCL1PPCAC_8090, partial [Pristionchus entomophagus]
ETIRLCDVQAFRNDLYTPSSCIRPVIYRYIDVIKNSIALMEAIHFELFMPDRPDLRFLGVQLTTVPLGTVEGDYFRVPVVDLLSNPSFAIRLVNKEFPVLWEVKRMEKIVRGLRTQSELAYIVDR